MDDRWRPNPGKRQTLGLVLKTVAPVLPEVTVWSATGWGYSRKKVGTILDKALAIVDFVRPGVGKIRHESMGKPLVYLQSERGETGDAGS